MRFERARAAVDNAARRSRRAGTFQSYLSLPPGAPSPIPTAANGAQPTALFFAKFNLGSGSSITIPALDNSPDVKFTVSTTAGCTTYYQVFGTPAGWQGYGTGVPASSGTTIDFPPTQNGSATDLTSATTYYVGLVCV